MPESKNPGKVALFFLSNGSRLKNRRLLKRFLPLIFSEENRALQSLNIIFCTDEYLLAINDEYLQHQDFTDIITFDLSNTPDAIVGEIYISLERVLENAPLFHNSFSDELHRVIFHGCLHLCGYADKSQTSQKLMRGREDFYLKKYRRFVSRETRST